MTVSALSLLQSAGSSARISISAPASANAFLAPSARCTTSNWPGLPVIITRLPLPPGRLHDHLADRDSPGRRTASRRRLRVGAALVIGVGVLHDHRNAGFAGLLQHLHDGRRVDGVDAIDARLARDAVLDHRGLLLRIEGRIEVGDLRAVDRALVVHALDDRRDRRMVGVVVDDADFELRECRPRRRPRHPRSRMRRRAMLP